MKTYIYNTLVTFIILLLWGCSSIPSHAQLLPPSDNPYFEDNNMWFTQGNVDVVPPTQLFDLVPPRGNKEDNTTELPFVYWIHGLGGSMESWEKASLATQYGAPGFPPRKVDCKVTQYNLDYSILLGAAGQLEDDPVFDSQVILQDDEATKRNYIIAHSQGGLVSRYLDNLYETNGKKRPFHGLVTFGSPHQGAYIINSMLEKEGNGLTRAENFTQEACDHLAPGAINTILKSIHNKLPPIKIKFLGITLKKLTIPIHSEFLQDFLTDEFCKIVPTVLNFTLSGLVGQPVNEASMASGFRVGGPAIAELNTFDTDTRKVAFVGIKDPNFNSGELFWRTFHYQAVSPNAYGYFGANDEPEKLTVDRAKTITEQYKHQMDYYMNQANYWENKWNAMKQFPFNQNGFYPPGYYYNQYKNNLRISGYYKLGYDWMLNIDPTWRSLIGAQDLSPEVSGYKCTCQGFVEGKHGFEEVNEVSIVQKPEDCKPKQEGPDVICKVEKIIQVNKELKQSDGLVLTESQMNFPGASYVAEMENSSHMQMRNDKALRISLLNLYDDDIVEKGWFNLQPK